jgi:hypothetical protein
MMADMTLPALPEESFQRVLCVVAHPDDMEYGTSAAVDQIVCTVRDALPTTAPVTLTSDAATRGPRACPVAR